LLKNCSHDKIEGEKKRREGEGKRKKGERSIKKKRIEN